MRTHEIVARLEGFRGRGAGTDAERRAASWLAAELEHPAREVRIEPFWCRPNWAFAHVWHVAVAIAGSLVSVGDAGVGLGLLLLALLSTSADALFGVSIGRRLTFERASQNVVARPRARRDGASPRLRLVITANYDAGRTGLVYRERFRGIASRLNQGVPSAPLGWVSWLCLGILWLAIVAILRLEGHHSTPVGVAQFIPTVLLILALAALIELATADYGPAANDNGSGVALAIALARALDAAPPRHLDVDLVLQGAGEGGAIGLRRHLGRRIAARASAPGEHGPLRLHARRRQRERDRTHTAVIAFAACGAGDLRWWTSDGSLLPLRYSKRLRELCAQISQDGEAAPYRGRGTTPAFPARVAGISAITLGCLDSRGAVPHSHRPEDVTATLDASALDATLEFALILVDAMDAFLGQTRATPPPRTQAAAGR